MRRQRGFSLIEILVVLVIMGLLISVVAPTVLNSADDARVQKVQADFKAIETALKIYRLDNFVYPSTEQGLVALIEPSTLEPEPRNFKDGGYLQEMPLDPWDVSTCTSHPVRTVRLTCSATAQTDCPVARARIRIWATGPVTTTRSGWRA